MPTGERPPRRKRRCSICDDAYDTDYVCGACRADPANEGWRSPSRLEQLTPDTEPLYRAPKSSRSKRPARPVKPRPAPVKALRVVQLLLQTYAVRYRYHDVRGHGRGWRTRSVHPTMREIAWLAGCSLSYVGKVLNSGETAIRALFERLRYVFPSEY